MEDKLTSLLKGKPQTNAELRKALGLHANKYDPKLDRTLQKLRKSGKLKVVNGKWALSSLKICSHCKGRGWTEE